MIKLKMLHKTGLPFVMAIVAAIGIIFGAGCEKKELETPPASNTEPTEQQTETHRQSLVNTSWKCIEFVENGISSPIRNYYNDCCWENRYLLNFNNDGEWRGTSSSNDMVGTYCVADSIIQIQISITSEVGETEDGYKYVDKLVRAASYDSDSVQLDLYINKSEYLVFERVVR